MSHPHDPRLDFVAQLRHLEAAHSHERVSERATHHHEHAITVAADAAAPRGITSFATWSAAAAVFAGLAWWLALGSRGALQRPGDAEASASGYVARPATTTADSQRRRAARHHPPPTSPQAPPASAPATEADIADSSRDPTFREATGRPDVVAVSPLDDERPPPPRSRSNAGVGRSAAEPRPGQDSPSTRRPGAAAEVSQPQRTPPARSLGELLEQSNAFRARRDYRRAHRLLSQALKQPWDRRTEELLSVELGEVLSRYDPEAACRHWRRHRRRFAAKRPATATAQWAHRAGCEAGSTLPSP
ncbi:MAG: hypothetical protein B7733_12345 [Myxococcales bacterium FL481]|nr:MAG: hypothetical protein B7733_12345 [Myxococcales bacterium FL481]